MKRKIKVFFTYCGADQALKDMAYNAVSPLKEKLDKSDIDLELIAMDNDCVDRWDRWSNDNALGCDIMVPIISEHAFEIVNGREKVILTEIALGTEHFKRLAPMVLCPLQGKTAERLEKISLIFTDRESFEGACVRLARSVELLAIEEAEKKRELESLSLFTRVYSNSGFVGRDADLEWMKKSFEKSNVLVLTGEGGIGKTTLAEEFFTANSGEYSGAFIVKAPLGIREGIETLPFAETVSVKNSEERYEKNKALLESLSKKIIIIFDNCDLDMTEREILDELRDIRCRAIITSRDGIDGENQIPVLRLGRMDNEALISLVRKHHQYIDEANGMSKTETDFALISLFESVDGHTLTVEMASAIMRDGDISISEIRERLLACNDKVMTERAGARARAFDHLSTLYNFARLGTDERRILNALCLISPFVGIERQALCSLLSLKSNNEINSLAKKTFLRYNEQKRTVSMHPLFADVYYQVSKAYKSKQYKTVTKYMTSIERDGADMDKNERTLNLCLFFTQKRSSWIKDKRTVGAIYNTIGRCLGEKSEYKNQLEYHKKALECYLGAHSGKESTLGVATSYNNMGLAYNELGEFKNAFEVYEKALELRQRAHAKNKAHVDIAWSYNNLGYTYGLLGDYQKELEYAKKALEVFIAAHADEPTHSDVASGHNNLGYAYENLGKYTEALESYQRGLELRLTAYKPNRNHPHIAQSYNNLGTVCLRLGQYDNALEHYKLALDIFMKVYSEIPNHPDIAWTYNEIGSTYEGMGKHEDAIKFFEIARSIWKEAFSDMDVHPVFATSDNNIGMAYLSLDQYDKALDHFKKAHSMLLKAHSDNPNHPTIAVSYNNLASVYCELGDFERVLEYHKRALEINLEIYKMTPSHPNIGLAYNNIGYAYEQMEEPYKAIDYYKKSLSIYLNSYVDNPYHEDIMNGYYNLASAYETVGDYEKAIENMKLCIEVGTMLFMDYRACDLAEDYEYIADLYVLVGDMASAEKSRLKAKSLRGE